MTRTVQFRSLALLNEADKDLTIHKPQTEDNMRLLLSVFDSLNNLYEKLNRLNYIIKRKSVEQIISHKNKGEAK